MLVANVIDAQTREWKRELISTTFHAEDAESIVKIPLARLPNDDELVWVDDQSREFSIKGAYELLHIKYASPIMNNI